jgi:transcriptional regulator with XRE-family HTH domain
VAQIAQKFEHFLDTYRRPDGSRWGGQDFHDATGGVVTRSYVTTLTKGRIENPGFEKLRAIAKAMNFPPELWFEDVENLPDLSRVRPSWFVDAEDNRGGVLRQQREPYVVGGGNRST